MSETPNVRQRLHMDPPSPGSDSIPTNKHREAMLEDFRRMPVHGSQEYNQLYGNWQLSAAALAAAAPRPHHGLHPSAHGQPTYSPAHEGGTPHGNDEQPDSSGLPWPPAAAGPTPREAVAQADAATDAATTANARQRSRSPRSLPKPAAKGQ